MKKINTILAITLFVIAGCIGCKSSGSQSDDLITVDVTKSYPKKELILQDFMDVEYMALETNDDFVTQGMIVDIGKEIILDRNARDGNIHIFDRTGKGLRKINRMGQGPEEYLMPINIILDEENSEMFVNDGPTSKIIVYDLYGTFKRSFRYKEGALVANIYNYDKDYLMCQDDYAPAPGFDLESHRNSFFLISKQDGSIRDIVIHFENKISKMLTVQDEGMIYANSPRNSLITPFQNNWLLTEPSSDTVFMYLSDHTMTPFIIRTPSVQSMDPETFLFPGVLTDHYYFMESVKKEYNFQTQTGFQGKKLMYDTQEKTIYEYTVNNNDYRERTENMSMRSINNEIAFYDRLEAFQLVEAYEKGQLKGRLKEIAAGLDEEDNPVIMIVKYKK
jgi:hypothetical protein